MNLHTTVQQESTMAMRALKRTTGNVKLVVMTVLHSPRCERTGGGWIWDRVRTQTRAAVWASAAISGPVLSGGVRSPTISEEGVITTLAGGR